MDRASVILGGGSLGLMIADELARKGQPAIVIDENPVGRYSTTRNQGWLQSGAYYATRGDQDAAEACREASARLRIEFSDLIMEDVDCFYLFESENQVQPSLEKCASLSITCQEITPEEMRAIRSPSPASSLLTGTPLKYGFRTKDRPIDTHQLLSRVADRAHANGTRFFSVPHLSDLTIDRDARGWQIRLRDGTPFFTETLIAACGPYIPTAIAELNVDFAKSLTVTKVPVLCLKGDLATFPAMVVTPKMPEGPNIVPFGRQNIVEGATVCLSGADEPCSANDPKDIALPTDLQDRFQRKLQVAFPHLLDRSPGSGLFGHAYMCQKLSPRVTCGEGPVSRRHIYDKMDESDSEGQFRTLVSVYPGKFTASILVAQEVAHAVISGETRDGQSEASLIHTPKPGVAVQPYYAESTMALELIQGDFQFRNC